MENLSYFNNASNTSNQEIWTIDLILSSILLIISLYFLVALVYHQITVEKLSVAKFFQMTLEKKYRLLSKYICILIGIFSVIRTLGDIMVKSLEWNVIFASEPVQPTNAATIACKIVTHISSSASAFGNLFVYIYLWLRQSIFYVQSTLKVLYSNKLKAFSFFILFFHLVFGISLCISFVIVVRYTLSSAGFCIIQPVVNNDTSFISILTTWNSLSIAMQVSLLGLFIYPLLKQASWNQNQHGMQNHRMLRVVKKAVIVASVCLVTDICTLVYLSLAISSDGNNQRTNVVYSGNLVVNYLVTIACFGYWRKLICPWSKKCQTSNLHTTVDET